MPFFSLSADCALCERRQASYIQALFCLCSDPDSQMCSLAFHGGTEAQLLGVTARKESAPLPLVGRSGALLWPTDQEKRGLQNKQSVTLLREKKTIQSFVWGLLADWNPRQCSWIIYMGTDFFPESSPTEMGKTKRHASHLPACQHYGHRSLSCFINCVRGELRHHLTCQPLTPKASQHTLDLLFLTKHGMYLK